MLAATISTIACSGEAVQSTPQSPPPASPQVIPLARYLRTPSQYALPLASRERDNEGEDP